MTFQVSIQLWINAKNTSFKSSKCRTCTPDVDEVEERELSGDAAIAQNLRPIAFSPRLVRGPLDSALLVLTKSVRRDVIIICPSSAKSENQQKKKYAC